MENGTHVLTFPNHSHQQNETMTKNSLQSLLDLTNFNLKLIHVSGKELNAPDALSRCPNLILKVDDNNEDITLLPPSGKPHQYYPN